MPPSQGLAVSVCSWAAATRRSSAECKKGRHRCRPSIHADPDQSKWRFTVIAQVRGNPGE
jgi:hypothetical protein